MKLAVVGLGYVNDTQPDWIVAAVEKTMKGLNFEAVGRGRPR